MGGGALLEVTVMRPNRLLSLGAVALAVGLGSGGISLMTEMPLVATRCSSCR
jgi:hypothetical protein